MSIATFTSPYTPQNDMDVYKLSAQLTIINRDNISSIGELEGKIESLKQQYEKTRGEFNHLTSKQDKLDSLVDIAESYFTLLDKGELSPVEELKVKMHKQTLESNNIRTRDDFTYLKSVHSETSKKITALKVNLESCKKLYDTYSDIAKTYREISEGDYISKFVEEKKRQKDRDKNRNAEL